MTQSQQSTHPTASVCDLSSVYPEVLNFYAVQMRALDSRNIEGYVSTFTEDGVMDHPDGASDRGHDEIVARLRERAPAFAGQAVCHWFDKLIIETVSDDRISSSYYAIVTRTTADGTTALSAPFLVRDVLSRSNGVLLTQRRTIAPIRP